MKTRQRIHYKKATLEDKITILCLVGPLFLKYLLPAGIENMLRIDIFGAILFSPYILLLIYMHRGIRSNENAILYPILDVQLCFALISWFWGDYGNEQYLAYLLNLTSYFLCYYIAIHYRFTQSQLEYLRKTATIVFFLVAIEMILACSGIVSFGYTQSDTESYGSISRFTTTMGDSNNGGLALFMFGMVTAYLNRGRILEYLIIILWIVGCALTVTKSVCLAVAIVGIIYYIKYLFSKKYRISSKLKITIIGIVSMYALFQLGVFNPIIERVSMQMYAENIQSGREELRENVLKKVTGTAKIIGHGSGSVYSLEELREKQYHTPYDGAPHNSYVLQYAEEGIIGLSLTLLFWLTFFVKQRKSDFWLLLSLLCMVGIFFNTETVSMVFTENQLIVAIAIMLLSHSKYINNKQI